MLTSPTDIYVLGLLFFERDMEALAVLTEEQLHSVTAQVFAIFDLISPFPTTHRGYSICRSGELGVDQAVTALLGPDLGALVEDFQLGYYHHRVILRFRIRSADQLSDIRSLRAQITTAVRSRFDRLTGLEVADGLNLNYIYSYALLVLRRGTASLRNERSQLQRTRYDAVFSVATTTFGLYLPEQRRLVRSRRHYIRISVPSTIVYVDGSSITPNLLSNLLSGIYYGGLYQRAQIDYERSLATNTPIEPNNVWTNTLLLSVFNVAMNLIRPSEQLEASVYIARVGVFVALLAVMFAGVAVLR